MCVSICISGVLKDKADLQRAWGVEPRGPDVSAKERLRRFYCVFNRDKVSTHAAALLVALDRYVCSVCVYGLPIYYLDLSSVLERSHIPGHRLLLGTVAPSLVHA